MIIDLRGNPGGYIKAGEILLQLFTDVTIMPHGFRFRSSEPIVYMLERSDDFVAWSSTAAQGARLGSEHSAVFPIEGDGSSYNTIGRVYRGPSVLIVDALTFSTADMFTAGFTDHAVGPIICTDENIAAGGANNWPYDVLRAAFPAFTLPAAAELELSHGLVCSQVRDIFSDHGQALSAHATAKALPSDRRGDLWEIADSERSYLIGKREWLRRDLAVYFDGDNKFVGDLPAGIGFGFSVRQAIRRERADGLVLEDEGIAADHYYKMTREDALSGNVRLIEFACGLLAANASMS